MRIKGGILLEIIIAIVLFSLILFPLIDINNHLFTIELSILELEKGYTNFLALKKQFRDIKLDFLEKNKGKYIYENIEGEKLENTIMSEIVFPYKIEKNIKIEIEIYKVEFLTNNERFKYWVVEIIYAINRREFKSKELVHRCE